MKPLYYLKVFFISFEFFVVLFFLFLYSWFNIEITEFIKNMKFNDKAFEWLILYPISLTVWILKDGIGVLFPDEKTNVILHKWPDYWMLKAHFNVGVFYAICFTILCVAVWLSNKILTASGATIFIACTVSLSIVALSLYNAKVRIREFLIITHNH